MPTEFQDKVYQATKEIPKGKVSTYQSLAKHINCRSAQAVGQALKRNPFAPQVPCHRVVNVCLKLHGFQGETTESTLSKKRKLLEDEGVKFLDLDTIDPISLYLF